MADDLIITLAGGDWLAIILATVAAFFIGFLWFTILFGERWAKEFGMDMDGDKMDFKSMLPMMAKDVVGNFLIAYVLLHSIVVWFPELWAEHFNSEMGSNLSASNGAMWMYALYSAGFTWLGFFVPVALSRTGWEKRSWGWFGIDVGYHLVKLLAMAMIIVYMTSMN